MAMTTINAGTDAPGLAARIIDAPGLAARIAEVASSVVRRISEASEGARAARHAGNLALLSDQQLAARGLTRDGIVAHAFSHLIGR